MKTSTAKIQQIFFLLLILLAAPTAYGSHIQGGNLTYHHIGGDTYEIEMAIIHACGGPSVTGAPVVVSTNCGVSLTVNLTFFSSSEVSPFSAGIVTDCNGGTTAGSRQTILKGLAVIPNSCTGAIARLVSSSCCRPNSQSMQNTNVSSLISSAEIVLANPHSSPIIDSNAVHFPIKTVCMGTTQEFHLSPIRQSKDSLHYSVDSVMTSYNTSSGQITKAPYINGYTVANPLPNFNLNSQTGLVSFTAPSTTGVYLVSFSVATYDRCSGVYQGKISYEKTIAVFNPTTNTCHRPMHSGIQNLNTGVTLVGSNEILADYADSICFDIVFSDSTTADTLTLRHELNLTWPSVVVSVSGTNPLTVNICGINDINLAYSTHKFTVIDKQTPLPNMGQFTFVVRSSEQLINQEDDTICAGNGIQLNAGGAPNIQWYTLGAGGVANLIVSGPDFSCNSCANPVANPAVTTTYIVKGDTNVNSNILFCNPLANLTSDTFKITVAPNFNVSAGADTNMCNGDSIVLTGTTSMGGTSSYWIEVSTGTVVLGNTITSKQTSTGDWVYTATSAAGCTKSDTVVIMVIQPVLASFSSQDLCSSNGQASFIPLNAGGSWSSSNVINMVTGVFSPMQWGTGSHAITYTIPGVCPTTETDTFNILPQANAKIIGDSIFCENDSIEQIMAYDTSGIWTGGNITPGGLFDPMTAGSGNHLVEYEILGLCGDKQSITIEVLGAPPTPVLTWLINGLGTSVSAVSYSWSINGSIPVISSTNTLPTAVIPNIGDTIVVCIQDSNGCESCSVPYIYTTHIGLEDALHRQLWVYPNPAVGQITIDQVGSEFNRLQIVDIRGKVVLVSHLNGGQNEIVLQTLATGVYGLILTGEYVTRMPLVIK